MVLVSIQCRVCGSEDVIKHGKTPLGKQRYKCQNNECVCTTFIQEHSYRGRLPEVKQQIIDMSLNGNGIRDTARVLKISPSTVIGELKKKSPNWNKSTAQFLSN